MERTVVRPPVPGDAPAARPSASPVPSEPPGRRVVGVRLQEVPEQHGVPDRGEVANCSHQGRCHPPRPGTQGPPHDALVRQRPPPPPPPPRAGVALALAASASGDGVSRIDEEAHAELGGRCQHRQCQGGQEGIPGQGEGKGKAERSSSHHGGEEVDPRRGDGAVPQRRRLLLLPPLPPLPPPGLGPGLGGGRGGKVEAALAAAVRAAVAIIAVTVTDVAIAVTMAMAMAIASIGLRRLLLREAGGGGGGRAYEGPAQLLGVVVQHRRHGGPTRMCGAQTIGGRAGRGKEWMWGDGCGPNPPGGRGVKLRRRSRSLQRKSRPR